MFFLAAFCGFLNSLSANPTTTGALILDSTFECISVTATFSGDSSANNSASVEWRKAGQTAWNPAYNPFIDRRQTILGASNTHVNEARTSIVGLTPGTAYEVRVTWTDPDGVTGTNPVTGNVTTQVTTPFLGQRILWVDGSLSAAGDGSSTTPYNSLAAAVSAAQPGDTIKIKPGAYPPLSISKSGNASAWIKLEGQAGGPVTVGGGINSITTDGNYLWFQGLTIPVSTTHGFLLGTANYVMIDNCLFPNISSANVYGNAGVSITANASHVWIRNCTFNTLNTSTGSDGAGNVFAIYFRSKNRGGGHVISDCVINGPFRDGIGGEGNAAGDGPVYNSDICRNLVCNVRDDAIECEGENRLVRIWGNILTNHTGQSIIGVAGTDLGPLYVFRNQMFSTNGVCAFKHGNNSPGPAYFFHNTIVTQGTGTADGFSDIGGSSYSELHVYMNNIVQTDRYGIYRGGRSNRYDYNLWNPKTWMVDEWNGAGSYQTLAQFKSATGQEAHGIQGSPAFTSNTRDISDTSPAVDKGLLIPNFNDPTSAWPFANTGPDLGHHETGSTAATKPSPPQGVRVIPQ